MTTDLSLFGNAGLEQLEKISSTIRNYGYPIDFELIDVKFAFDESVGDVFITNWSDQICILKDDRLCVLYTTPSGKTGVLEDLMEVHDTCDEDYFEDIENEIVEKLAMQAFKEAADETMKVMGYNMIAKDGWVIKKYADGREEKISKYAKNK